MTACQRIRQSDTARPTAQLHTEAPRRRGAGLLMMLVALVSLCAFGAAEPAEAAPGSHPYFNDQGTLVWYHSVDEAVAAAKAQNKIILLEAGRRRCPQCRNLCTNLIPNQRVRQDLSKVAVGLVADADRMPRWMSMMFRKNLVRPATLPLVAFMRTDKSWITGFWGRRSLTQFETDVARAHTTWESLQPACGSNCQDGQCDLPGSMTPFLPENPTNEPTAVQPETAPEEQGPQEQDSEQQDIKTLAENDVIHPTRAECDEEEELVREAKGSPDGRILAGGHAHGSPDGAKKNGAPREGDEKIRPVRAPPADLRAKAEAARDRGAWGRVLQLSDKVEGMEDLARAARRWASDTLQLSVRLLRARSLVPARKSLEAVATEFDGFPAAVDAKRGLEALRVIDEIRFFEPDSAVGESLRKKAYEDMRGSRWAVLFEDK